MYLVHFSLLLHFVGIGLLFAALFGGFILNRQYRLAEDPKIQVLFLRSIRLVGLLSPTGILLMLLSGIGNMTLGGHKYTLFSDGWLSAKLVIVALLILLGVFLGLQGTRRTRLVLKRVEARTTDEEEHLIRSIDIQLMASSIVQFGLLLIVMFLSILRPF